LTRRIAVVSGGFDPLHSGHVAMILAAVEHGPVHVVLNSDRWLARKKGYSFMRWDERASVVGGLRGVVAVHEALDADGTVVKSLAEIMLLDPGARITFCNGGDRVSGNTPEEEFCEAHCIRLAYGVGGGKTQSSSALVERARGLSPSPL
jgi:cytidyltransferase-like protein